MPNVLESHWIITDNPPTAPDGFVIPSYALASRTRPTRPTAAQIDLAIDWWRRYPRAILIMSTGDNQGLGIPNSQVMADYAARCGVPADRLVQESRSLTTYQNLLFSRRICDERGLRQPTLVTLDLYTRRAVATAARMGWSSIHWLSVYAPGEPAFGYKWLQTFSRGTILCYEMAAMAWSKLVGWV